MSEAGQSGSGQGGSGQRLALLTPHGVGEGDLDALVPALASACAAGDVAAVILRLALTDERALTAVIKRVAPTVGGAGAALVAACPGFPGDLITVAARGGADGVHLDKAKAGTLGALRARLRDGRILGAGGLESRHAAMEAGEAGVDYVVFGGLYPDGAAPDPEAVRARAAWWAEIFETPCIAVAAAEDEVAPLAATGAEFVGLDGALWLPGPEAVARAGRRLAGAAA